MFLGRILAPHGKKWRRKATKFIPIPKPADLKQRFLYCHIYCDTGTRFSLYSAKGTSQYEQHVVERNGQTKLVLLLIFLIQCPSYDLAIKPVLNFSPPHIRVIVFWEKRVFLNDILVWKNRNLNKALWWTFTYV